MRVYNKQSTIKAKVRYDKRLERYNRISYRKFSLQNNLEFYNIECWLVPDHIYKFSKSEVQSKKLKRLRSRCRDWEHKYHLLSKSLTNNWI